MKKKELTFTNYIMISGVPVSFNDLPQKKKEKVANYIIKRPLEALGYRVIVAAD